MAKKPRGGLQAWFGSGKTGGVGGGGWDRYDSSGKRIGKCGEGKAGDPYAACLSRDKADKLGKEGVASFVRRKRKAQAEAGASKKGEGKGSPVFVPTGTSSRRKVKK
jgi:hypothetical protein